MRHWWMPGRRVGRRTSCRGAGRNSCRSQERTAKDRPHCCGSGHWDRNMLDHGDGNKLHWQLTPFDFLYHQIQVGAPARLAMVAICLSFTQQPITLLPDTGIFVRVQLHIIADTRSTGYQCHPSSICSSPNSIREECFLYVFLLTWGSDPARLPLPPGHPDNQVLTAAEKQSAANKSRSASSRSGHLWKNARIHKGNGP